ncbi:MAG: hypothetical protein DDT25_00922 [Chloroflexi bacterium]|nr:hypothetical protein [Chloroflexota bacterium]
MSIFQQHGKFRQNRHRYGKNDYPFSGRQFLPFPPLTHIIGRSVGSFGFPDAVAEIYNNFPEFLRPGQNRVIADRHLFGGKVDNSILDTCRFPQGLFNPCRTGGTGHAANSQCFLKDRLRLGQKRSLPSDTTIKCNTNYARSFVFVSFFAVIGNCFSHTQDTTWRFGCQYRLIYIKWNVVNRSK